MAPRDFHVNVRVSSLWVIAFRASCLIATVALRAAKWLTEHPGVKVG